MDISNALMVCYRDPDMMAWRASGTALGIRPGGVIMRLRAGAPYRWVPKFEDLVAMDWRTGTQEQFLKQFRPDEASAQ